MSGDPRPIDLTAALESSGQIKGQKKTPRWPYRNDKGKPTMCVENVEALLKHYGCKVRFNLMSHKVEVEAPGEVIAERRNSIGFARIRALARKFGLTARAGLDDILEEVVARNPYHPVADWISSKPWDGVSRIETLFDTLILDPEFATPVRRERSLRMFRMWLVTGARAAMVPAHAIDGIAGQGVLVLQGRQELGKTRWIMSLLPEGLGWSHEGIQLDASNRDHIQRATEFFLVELGEIDASIRKSDVAALKAFITSRADTYRRAYGRETETSPRRTIYAASVNEKCFLSDDTGNRRFWILRIIGLNPLHGIDMQQVWAEAAALFLLGDELWMSAEDARDLAEANLDHEIDDPLHDQCAKSWTADTSETPTWVDLDEVKRVIDSQRTWTIAEARALARIIRNKLGAKTRKEKGYTRYALQRT